MDAIYFAIDFKHGMIALVFRHAFEQLYCNKKLFEPANVIMVVSNLGTRDQRSKNNPSMEEAPHTNQKLYTSNTYNGLPKRINDLLDRSTPLVFM